VNITGTAIMHAPAGQVWAALTDPAVLVRSIPGCERLEPAGLDSYRFTVTAGVASVRGTYTGEVALSQQREPTSLVLTARCAGGPGTVATTIHITLTPAGATTEVGYNADAAVGGLIAGVGQRMLASVAGRLAAEFFTSVDQVLTGHGAPPANPAPPAVPGPTEVHTEVPIAGPTAVPTQGATAAPVFLGGALVGAAATAAGVAIARLIGRRAR
jgi:hypothetical protein